MPKLVWFHRAEIIAEYVLARKKEITIGSSRLNDIVLNEKSVSEHHVTIAKADSGVYGIKDNNTITGTKVNDRTISEKDLKFGDIISVGSATFRFLPDRRPGVSEGEGETVVLPKFSLLGVYGLFDGKRYDVYAGDTNIGREPVSPKGIENDVILKGDMTVSKGHASITCQDDGVMIKDVGSTGGVAVNGNKVGQLNSAPLKAQDEIAVGRTIFRLVEFGKWDYSSPKRHRIWLLKVRDPLIQLVTAAVIIFGVFAMVNGMRTALALKSKPSKMSVEISRDWSASGNVTRPVPSELDVTGGAALADVNGDGSIDVVVMSPSGYLSAWNGVDGSRLWNPVEINNPGLCSPAVADMNGDLVADIVVTGDGSVLYIIDGATGGIVRKEVLGGALSGLSPVVCDMDRDGKMDVVACAEEGMVHILYSPGYASGMEKYTEFVDGTLLASPAVIMTPKISSRIVVCTNNGKVIMIDASERTKRLPMVVDLVEKTGKVHLIAATPAIGDLNNDGVPEVVVQSNVPQYVSSLDIMSNNVNWTYFVDPVPPAEIKHHASPLITDVNGDGMGDVIVVSANGNLYALKGKTGYPTGELLWKLEVPELKRTIATPALYDFDRNGVKDFVVGTEDGSLLFVRNSPKRKGMEIMTSVRVSNGPITASAAIADVNGDRRVDVVSVNMDNAVILVKTNVKTLTNALLWPVHMGTNYRSGQPPVVENVGYYWMKALFGLLALAAIIAARFMMAGKKASRRPRLAYL